MSVLKEIREKLCLSQEQLAIHLGIHRVQLALAEKGHRALPSAAESKLTQLLVDVYTPMLEENLQDDKSSAFIDKKTVKIIEKTQAGIDWHTENLEKLRSSLEQMKMLAEQSSESKGLISRMSDKKMEGKDEEGRRVVLDMQKLTVQKRSQQNNSVAQALLEARIELLEAKVKIGERLLKKLSI